MIKINKILSISAFVLLSVGCAPSSYVVKSPSQSNMPYQAVNVKSPLELSFADKRESASSFSTGVLKADLVLDGKQFDSIQFIKDHTIREIQARGIDIKLAESENADVNINKLVMKNHRTNAYTPFITLTMLSADIVNNGQKERVAVFIKRGKVPVWSFDEIINPTLNEPLELLIKEFSAKLTANLYAAKLSDNEVLALIARLSNRANKELSYLDVYELGFSNNIKAATYLRDLTKSDDEYVRMAAISSLGILKDQASLLLLKDLSKSAKTWTDRAMALKSIGDIGGEEATAFLRDKKVELEGQDSKEELWSTEIIDLYL
ncbi:HEAT repeat domain-containing protein [Bowmanella sp. Y26]|uniref:HEAT repeat domain-containing protein n=1 Tax=Bowmanella yangjiangensis TaxID=2811230 RepID=UPI001BDDC555|nr:HEAT repeat domain-containing protein [Bowmanella yangjiangensis]MBT1064187.1 HEAT repeat domain-containing protein [Bowmanella yangjiangensis]